MKKVNITSLALLCYLVIMAVIGWPGSKYGKLSFPEYFMMIGVTLVVIVILRFLQIKRSKAREKWKNNDDSIKKS